MFPRTVWIPTKETAADSGQFPSQGIRIHSGGQHMLWKDFLSSGEHIRRVEAAAYHPAQVALVCYTAERTQQHLTQDACVAYLKAACTALGKRTGHLRVLSVLPVWQAAGIVSLLVPLLCGHCLLLGAGATNGILLARIFNEKVDHIYADAAFFAWALQRETISATQRAFLVAQEQAGLWRLS